MLFRSYLCKNVEISKWFTNLQAPFVIWRWNLLPRRGAITLLGLCHGQVNWHYFEHKLQNYVKSIYLYIHVLRNICTVTLVLNLMRM